MSAEYVSAEKRLAARVVVLEGAAHPCTEALADKVERLLRERDELRRDVARYDNGRIVLMAELEAAKERTLKAEQLAMRQANEIRKLQKATPLHDFLAEPIKEKGL
jgi:hypothetical protein